MAFSKVGIVAAPKIVASVPGLLHCCPPENSADEDRWVRGFAQEWETSLYSAKLYDDTDTTSDTVATDATPTYYADIKPFFIEVEEIRSTLSFNGLDRIARITRQLEGVTQKAMEKELWDGAIRKGQTHDNKALSDANTTLVNGTTALSAVQALARLEFTMAQASPCGENGIIHMTRDVAGILSAEYTIFRTADQHLETVNGTRVVIGSGYSGAGPTGQTGAAASATNKWMYGTGTVKTYLGKVDVVNDNLAQAYDVSGNAGDMRLKAIRPAAVYFDETIHLAVRVDLSV